MLKPKVVVHKITSSLAKVIFPIIFTCIFLFPLIYYWGLLWISGISNHHSSYFVIDKAGEIQFQKKKPASWTSIKQIPTTVSWPIIVSEDWDFFHHSGVDWQQLKLVLIDGVKKLNIKRGASTITQQVIKNLFLSDERSFFRKFNEIILAYYLESKVSKNWILEQYLNLAEFDKGIYGIKGASHHYFKKSPNQLRFKEGAFLAMLLPSPKKYSVSYYKKDLTPFAKKQVSRILGKLVIARIITREKMHEELSTPLSWERNSQVLGLDILDSLIEKIKQGEENDESEANDDINSASEVEFPSEPVETVIEPSQPLVEAEIGSDEDLSPISETNENEIIEEQTEEQTKEE